MSALWRFHLLGELRAVQGDRAVTRFRTTKTAGLLAYLVIHRDRVPSRDSLLDLFWPDSPLEKARSSLSVALNSLRQQLEPPHTPGSSPTGDFVIADRTTVRLNADAFSCDVTDFEAAASSLDSEGAGPQVENLLRAEQLYRGELLPGYFDDWVVAERERLAALYIRVLHRLVAVFLEQGDRDRAVEFVHKAACVNPDDEETGRLRTRLTHRRTEPRRTESRAASGERFPAAAVAHPSTPSPATGDNLPTLFTRFFGREEESRSIEAALGNGDGRTRLLTLTGFGGAGKTRLAIESATRLKTAFPGGVYFVGLADLPTTAHIANAIRNALGLPRTPSTAPLAQIVASLAQRQPCLLVLDNLEHLMGHGPLDGTGAAAVVRTLLGDTPSTAILATSRQRLDLPGEQELPVAPLPLPPADDHAVENLLHYPAVQLFVNRAQTRRVDFRLTPHNAPAVSRLCARLEGGPLAIELAASWAKLFTPAQMLERLQDGFAFLESRQTAVPARHRSLWAAVAWSYVLLPPEIQRFFARLALFRGGCTPEAAALVCGDDTDALSPQRALEYLTRLYDASLLVTEEVKIGVEQQMRLRLREPIRDFAAGQLTPEERTATRRRYDTYFLQFAEDAYTRVTGPEQQAWFDRLGAENDNLRTVLSDHTGDTIGLRIAGALARFWTIRGYFREGADWLHQVLAAPENALPSPVRARALSGAGVVAYHRTELEAARAYFLESLRVGRECGDTDGAGRIILNLGNVAYRQADYREAQDRYEEALSLFRARNDDSGIASALGSLGNVAQDREDYPAARAYQEESLARSRANGDIRMTAYTLHNLGNLAVLENDPERARLYYEESLLGTRSLGDRRGVAALLTSLSALTLPSGDYVATRQQLAEAITLVREVEDPLGMLSVLDAAAWYAQVTGSGYESAAVLWAAAENGRRTLASPRQPDGEAQSARLQETARRSLSPELFAAAWERGSSLSLEAAIVLALAEVRDNARHTDSQRPLL